MYPFLNIPETRDHTYKHEITNFRSRWHPKKTNNTKCVWPSSFNFPKRGGRRVAKTISMLMLLSKHDGGLYWACVLFDHNFAKGSKVNC